MVMFDLPVKTKPQRKGASKYRKNLLDLGFSMVQFSVYAKYVINATGLRAMLPVIKAGIPPDGEVRVLRLTDEQWAATYRYYGLTEVSMEAKPEQLGLALDLDDELKKYNLRCQ
jgi:CRISPR-associated protein Cas2